MKEINISTAYITLGQLIKYLSLVNSGGEVKSFILENTILINGEKEEKRGRKIYPSDIVIINKNSYWINLKQ